MSIKTGLEYIGYIDPWTDEERLSDEEIVRCGECKFYVPNEQGTLGGCTLLDFYTAGMEHGFCAWGERKGE